MSSDVFTVLVVCTGNVNRSALGAVLLETWADWYLPASTAEHVRVTSAGLGAPAGAKMGRRSRAIAEALGADGSRHRAKQITEDAVRAADLVLVSSSRQRDDVLGLVPAALRSTFTIREVGRIAEALPVGRATRVGRAAARPGRGDHREPRSRRSGDDDIIDPQGKDDEAYRLMARQEVPPLARLASALFGMPPAEVAAYEAAADAAEFSFDGEARDQADDARTRPRGRREA